MIQSGLSKPVADTAARKLWRLPAFTHPHGIAAWIMLVRRPQAASCDLLSLQACVNTQARLARSCKRLSVGRGMNARHESHETSEAMQPEATSRGVKLDTSRAARDLHPTMAYDETFIEKGCNRSLQMLASGRDPAKTDSYKTRSERAIPLRRESSARRMAGQRGISPALGLR